MINAMTREQKKKFTELTWVTEEQAKALPFHENTVVSASAGTGKTKTLISKLMYGILNQEYTVDEVLAITYTNAGASEMKKRLKEELQNEGYLEIFKDDLEQYSLIKDLLEHQKIKVETASITTIHGFCKNILTNYGYLLHEVTSDQINTVIDDGTLENLKNKAFKQTINAFSTPNNIVILERLMDAYVTKPTSFFSLKEVIEKTSVLIRDKDLEMLLEKIDNTYFQFDSIQDIKDPNVKKIMSHEFENLYSDILMSLELFDFSSQSESGLFDLKIYLESLSLEEKLKISTIEKVENLVKEIYSKENNLSNELKIFKSDDSVFNKVKGESLLFSINRLFQMKHHKYHEIMDIQKQTLLDLIKVAQEYQKNLDLLKKDIGGIYYDDQIYYAVKILKEHPSVLEELQNKFKIILVDEFQDTNDIQDYIINLLAEKPKNNPHMKKSVFRVGDVKQSIYSFQGAKPELMKSYIAGKNNSEKLTLSTNFRSKLGIIDDVNKRFIHAMNIFDDRGFVSEDDTSNIGGVKFKDEKGIETKHQEINSKPIEYKLFVTKLDVNEVLADQIAQSIYNSYINSDKEQYDTYKSSSDGTKQQLRNFNYGDITILVPKRKFIKHLEKAFDKYNIPSDIVETKGFYQIDFIKGITNWFRYLLTEEEYYLIDLFKVIFDFDYNDLIKTKDNDVSLLEGLKKNKNQEYIKFDDFCKRIKKLDATSSLIEIGQFISENKGGFTEEETNNFDLLMYRVSNLGISKPTISDFVTYLDTVLKKDHGEDSDSFDSAKVYSKYDNVVKIMTYHGSKGLEFPIVYVWPIEGHKPKFEGNIFYDNDFGLVIKSKDKFNNALKNIYLQTYHSNFVRGKLEEEIRLFYVALTRATHRAHMFDVIKDDQDYLDTLKVYRFNEHSKYHLNNYLKRFWIEDYKKSYLSLLLYEENIDYINVDHISEPNLHDNNLELSENKNHDFDINELSKIKMFQSSENIVDELIDDGFLEFKPHFIYATGKGTVIHDTLEHIIHEKQWNDALYDKFNLKNEYRKMLTQFKVNKLTKELLGNAKEIHSETPVIYKNDNDNPVQNIIDLYLVYEDKVIIVDYKTDRGSSEENFDLKDDLLFKYTQQLSNYRNIIINQYPTKSVHAYIYSFELDSYIDVMTQEIVIPKQNNLKEVSHNDLLVIKSLEQYLSKMSQGPKLNQNILDFKAQPEKLSNVDVVKYYSIDASGKHNNRITYSTRFTTKYINEKYKKYVGPILKKTPYIKIDLTQNRISIYFIYELVDDIYSNNENSFNSNDQYQMFLTSFKEDFSKYMKYPNRVKSGQEQSFVFLDFIDLNKEYNKVEMEDKLNSIFKSLTNMQSHDLKD